MNRRDFLYLAAAAVAGTVAAVLGVGRGDRTCGGSVEPMVTGLRRVTSPEIVLTDYGRIVTNAAGTSWTALVPSDLLDDTQFDLQAYIEAEIYGQLIDHELLEGATGPVLGVISCA